jgi:hypothetical protein
MKKLLVRGGLVVLILVVVGLVGLYFSLNGIVKGQIESQGTAATGVETNVDSVALSPFSGALGLDRFRLANPEGFDDQPIFKFDDADTQVALGSLLSDEIVVRKVHIDGAQVLVSFNNGQLNVKSLYDQIQKQGQSDDTTTQDPPSDGAAPGFVVEDLRITNTKVLGELHLPGIPDPLKIDLPLADITDQDVRGAEMGDVIAFVVETIMINASRSLSEFSPDLDQFMGGLQDAANALVEDTQKQLDQAVGGVTGKVDEVVPGAGEALNQKASEELERGKQKLGEELGNLLGGNKDEQDSQNNE